MNDEDDEAVGNVHLVWSVKPEYDIAVLNVVHWHPDGQRHFIPLISVDLDSFLSLAEHMEADVKNTVRLVRAVKALTAEGKTTAEIYEIMAKRILDGDIEGKPAVPSWLVSVLAEISDPELLEVFGDQGQDGRIRDQSPSEPELRGTTGTGEVYEYWEGEVRDEDSGPEGD